MAFELCKECDEPTGRAGKGEDSLYAGDFGPYCESCWGDVPEDLADIIEAQRRKMVSMNDIIVDLYESLESALSDRGYEGEDGIENYSEAKAFLPR
tara:strand:- start:4402 stop:4689 length:288 start_codon:yes stop_codon:yes gene_type:complete